MLITHEPTSHSASPLGRTLTCDNRAAWKQMIRVRRHERGIGDFRPMRLLSFSPGQDETAGALRREAVGTKL